MYNEELNLIRLHANLSVLLPEEEKCFVLVDDFSSDDSVIIAQELFGQYQHKIITKTANFGPGHSFNLGFKWILDNSKNDSDIIIGMEADNTSDSDILPEMIALNRFGYSMVLASVYAQGGGFEKTSFFRKIISFLANMVLRLVYDIKILTLSSFYRVYNVALIRKIDAVYQGKIIEEHGFICMLEILLKAINLQAKVVEVPMLLRSDKRKGKSKMKVFKTTLAYIKFLLTFKHKKLEN